MIGNDFGGVMSGSSSTAPSGALSGGVSPQMMQLILGSLSNGVGMMGGGGQPMQAGMGMMQDALPALMEARRPQRPGQIGGSDGGGGMDGDKLAMLLQLLKMRGMGGLDGGQLPMPGGPTPPPGGPVPPPMSPGFGYG